MLAERSTPNFEAHTAMPGEIMAPGLVATSAPRYEASEPDDVLPRLAMALLRAIANAAENEFLLPESFDNVLAFLGSLALTAPDRARATDISFGPAGTFGALIDLGGKRVTIEMSRGESLFAYVERDINTGRTRSGHELTLSQILGVLAGRD